MVGDLCVPLNVVGVKLVDDGLEELPVVAVLEVELPVAPEGEVKLFVLSVGSTSKLSVIQVPSFIMETWYGQESEPYSSEK